MLFAKWTSRRPDGVGVVTTGGVPVVIVGVAVPVKKKVNYVLIVPCIGLGRLYSHFYIPIILFVYSHELHLLFFSMHLIMLPGFHTYAYTNDNNLKVHGYN